jgi:hypothetical protein
VGGATETCVIVLPRVVKKRHRRLARFESPGCRGPSLSARLTCWKSLVQALQSAFRSPVARPIVEHPLLIVLGRMGDRRRIHASVCCCEQISPSRGLSHASEARCCCQPPRANSTRMLLRVQVPRPLGPFDPMCALKARAYSSGSRHDGASGP